jgi:hypothetical protein
MEEDLDLGFTEKGLSQNVKNELGLENLNNIKDLTQAIKAISFETGTESHLLLVGGMVKPEKSGKYHKDVDLVFYCPSLATEIYTGGEHKKFDEFAIFFKKVNEKLGWKMEVEEPWFQDYEVCGDGKIILFSDKGVPIEVLPTREDILKSSFQEFLENDKNNNPSEIIF